MRTRFSTVDSVLVSGFVLLLLVPLGLQLLLSTVVGNDNSGENRVFAKAPSLPTTLDDWLGFPGEFEKYYKDSFGLREPLLSIAITSKRITGISPNFFTKSGKDGWVFLTRQSLKDSLEEEAPWQEEELDDFYRRMQRLEGLLNEQGIVFVHFAAPEKQSIYPEYLPLEMSSSRPNRLEQLTQRLKGSDAYIDVKKVLLSEKAREPTRLLYQEIDTHWNCFGAYLVYREVISKGLIDRGLKLSLVSDKDFKMRVVSSIDRGNRFSPDFWLSSLSAHNTDYECLLEESPLLEMRLDDGANVPNINGEIGTPESTFPGGTALFQNWRSLDKRDTAQLKAVVIRDSFMSRLVPYLSRTFSEVVYIHQASLYKKKYMKALVEEFQPDVVIYEYAERHLDMPDKVVLEPVESILEKIKIKGR